MMKKLIVVLLILAAVIPTFFNVKVTVINNINTYKKEG